MEKQNNKLPYVAPSIEVFDLAEMMPQSLLISLSANAEFTDWAEDDTIDDWGGVDIYR